MGISKKPKDLSQSDPTAFPYSARLSSLPKWLA
jgi:hypothetical protein